MTNRLASETSPYLLQHKNNPVDWYPWGPEALDRAKKENRPILLSIGYSACHWCHVMEHESFENSTIAELMNRNFVCIKVDREERPDLDHIYQNVAQAMTRGGGWPLTVFLTPTLEPFFGGTYFPPDDRYGRPGFPRVLEGLSRAFREDPETVAQNARNLTDYIARAESSPALAAESIRSPELSIFEAIAQKLLAQVDWQNGGIVGAPKFPNPMLFTFLWRYGLATQNPGEPLNEAQNAAVLALTQMCSGGIYDQLRGGFHRYSVDEHWAVPHFEKMLYDNALLIKLIAEVLLTGPQIEAPSRALLTHALSQSVEYLLEEMHSPEGGFYSTQDADSEGEEGKFFVWDPADLATHLTADEARAFALRYGVTDSGNFEHGKTVLFVAKSMEEIARELNTDAARAETLIEGARTRLLSIRAKRIAPARDEKILASWNGLAVSGFVWATMALEAAEHESHAKAGLASRARLAAEAAYRFVVNKMQVNSRLLSVYKDGQAKNGAYLDDYAFMAQAAVDLARIAPDEAQVQEYNNRARTWIQTVLDHFGDTREVASAGYFFTPNDHEALISRPKTLYDQAIPAGTAVVLRCLAVLSELDGDTSSFDLEFRKQLSALLESLVTSPYGQGELACTAWLGWIGPITTTDFNLCSHPQVFRKPRDASSDKPIFCHQKTCYPLTDKPTLLWEKTRISRTKKS